MVRRLFYYVTVALRNNYVLRIILVRTLRRDIAQYNKEDEEIDEMTGRKKTDEEKRKIAEKVLANMVEEEAAAGGADGVGEVDDCGLEAQDLRAV